MDIITFINSLTNEDLNRIRNSKSDAEARRLLREHQALKLQQTGVMVSAWIEVVSDHEITEYSKNLEPIWIILEDDEFKIPILAQPNGNDDYYGEDDVIYHYCDISHFMKIQRPVF